MELRIVHKEEIEDIVAIHCAAFRDFFLTELGPDFLTTYYEAFRKSDRAILVGCFENDRLLGFSAGVYVSAGFNTYLVRTNLLPFLLQGLKIMIVKPSSIFRSIKNFKKVDNTIIDKGLYAELFSIAVLPNQQGLGIGKQLIEKFEADLKMNGCKEVSLTTDVDHNESTLLFYQSVGFHILYPFTSYPHRKMYRLIKQL